jgi:hypothetical protein
MYEFLFDQTYINLFVLALLLFLVMFLWRKVTIIEGNYFLLEKRVNIIKKEGREDLLAKNANRTVLAEGARDCDVVMNEIFKDSVGGPGGAGMSCPIGLGKKACTNLNYESKLPNNISTQNEYNISEDTSSDFRNDIKQYAEDISDITDITGIAGITDIVDVSINYFDLTGVTGVTGVTEDASGAPGAPGKSASKFEIIEEPSEITGVTGVTGVTAVTAVTAVTEEEVAAIPIDTGANDICDISDNVSVCSDITFNTEDKSIARRFKNMNVEKLREECKEKSLNTEGNKAVLISRLVDSIKKQK